MALLPFEVKTLLVESEWFVFDYVSTACNCFTSCISDDNCEIWQSHGSQKSKPAIWAWQDNSQYETGGADHHGNEISLLPASLITSQGLRSTCDVVNLLFSGHVSKGSARRAPLLLLFTRR